MKRKRLLRGNENAVKQGGYRQLTHLDGRTREAKILGEIEAALVTSLGGNPSPQQILLIKRACVKAFRCLALEHEIIRNNGNVPDSLQQDYLRWARELREDLKALGLERRAKDVTDLKSWAEAKYGDQN